MRRRARRSTSDLDSPSLKVIADHIRACAFLIVDGVMPGSEGRGYVLRRIIRRAIRHGYQLGQKQPFFHRLVEDLDRQMGEAYPELTRDKARVAQVLKAEEERFGETLENGMRMLEQALRGGQRVLDGETAFTLYDTFGFPLDLTADVARERGVAVDEAGFDRAMNAQRERARAASPVQDRARRSPTRDRRRVFRGYETLSEEGRVVALYKDGARVESLTTGERGVVVLDRTPFYAESGGQVGDRGELSKGGACLTLFAVEDTQKIQPDVVGHVGEVKTGELRDGDHGGGRRRPRRARAHDAQPLGDAPDAQGAARGARRARAAEGLARRSGQDALRLRAQRADDRRRDPPRRGDRQRGDPRQRGVAARMMPIDEAQKPAR